jgi:hypothetical protein
MTRVSPFRGIMTHMSCDHDPDDFPENDGRSSQ